LIDNRQKQAHAGNIPPNREYFRQQFDGIDPGESGTGKELIAEAIHRSSNRKDKPSSR